LVEECGELILKVSVAIMEYTVSFAVTYVDESRFGKCM